MVTRKSRAEIAKMRQAGRIVAEVLDLVGQELKPGVTTGHLREPPRLDLGSPALRWRYRSTFIRLA